MDQLTWFKSSYSSANGQCVECARTQDGGMFVRDSKHPAAQVLSFPRETWQSFLATAKRPVVS
jgi:hypothetical protein